MVEPKPLDCFAQSVHLPPDDGKIVDNNVVYTRNADAESFSNDLAEEPEVLGNGVEWFGLNGGLDNDSKELKGLLTRRDSRAIVDVWINRTKEREAERLPSMSFIIGSPGIGKSRTLSYALRQLLQEENVNVQYFVQKENKAFLFLRRNQTTYVYRSEEAVAPPAVGKFFQDLDGRGIIPTYILVDPTEDGAKYSHPSSAHLLVSCSANIKHFHNIDKERAHRSYYLGLPSIKEIEVYKSKLKPNLSAQELHRLINDVGPVPRYLFNDQYESRKGDIKKKAESTKLDAQKVLDALIQGDTVSDDPTLCGALFAHVNVETKDENGRPITDYTQQRITVLSRYAAWCLYKRFRSTFVAAIRDGGDCDVRTVFEKLCAFDLTLGGNFNVVDMKSKSQTPTVKNFLPGGTGLIRVMPSRNETQTRDKFVRPALEGKKNFRSEYDGSESYESYQPPNKRVKSDGFKFIILSEGYSAIDFINTDRQVFQATRGDDHNMAGWVNLLLDAKILLENNGMLTINSEAQQLEFYWVVPQHVKSWKTKGPKCPNKRDLPERFKKQSNVVERAIKRHVNQYVLLIEEEQPQASEFWSNLNPLQGVENCLIM